MDRVYINGDGIQLTNADIVQNSLTIDRYSATGANIELGSAVAAELSFKMFNSDGRWDDFVFEGKDLFVRVNDVPMGYFTVDEPPRKLSTITIRALDRMVQFDQPYETDLLFPATVADIISDCCDKCDIVIGNLDLINEDVVINEKPQADTFRTVLRWCAEITGTCAYIDGNGELQMSWYEDSDFEIDGSMRYEGSDFYKEPIQITGVKYKDVLVGTDEYAIEIIGNLILYNMKELETVLGNIYNRINGLVYHPYNVVVKSQIGLMPLQKIKYVDKNNAEYPSIVTHHTYRLNGRSTVKAVGQTKTRKGYAALNPVTPHEQEILQNMREETREELTGYETLLLHLNEQINNSLGLYTTVREDTEGGKIVYSHDKPTLEESNYISVRSAAGYAWTNEGWNEGFPNWEYGVDSGGNAIFNQIATAGLDANWVKIGQLRSADNAINIDLDNRTVNFADLFKIENVAGGSKKLTIRMSSGRTVEEEISQAQADAEANAKAYVNPLLEGLQEQIDGSITTWFYDYPPTPNNLPAVNWTTTDEKNIHLGDLFYDTVTGYCYRWNVSHNEYSWQRITDTDITKALEDASKAQATADRKMQVFVSQPTNEVSYQVGDLWIRDGEVWTCKTAKIADAAFNLSHWEKKLKYTDDTVANANLAEAKSYAETKAIEAENASKAYAEAKAETARIEAEAYADGKVTAEEQARINDANAKLAEAKSYAETKAIGAQTAAQNYAEQQAINAQSAAQSYADAKAEAERVLAEAYADGIVDEEEQARINDVQARLAEAKSYAEQQDELAKQAAQEYADLLAKGSSMVDRDYQTGVSLYSDKADNANVHVDIEGASFQENEPNPENPSEIKSVGTYNPTTEKYEFDVVSSKGNRNLLRNSDFSDGLTNWANQGYSLSVVDGVLIAKNVSGTGTRFYYDIIQMPIGETYTISFEAKADKNNSEVFLGQGFSGLGTISLTTVWKRYNITFQSVNNYTISFYLSEPDVDYYFTNIKLEKGNKATDWTPAPEDINYNVSENGINKIAISLDEPLRSVGDVKDRIFRDGDGLWKIERNIAEYVADGTEDWMLSPYGASRWDTQGNILPVQGAGIPYTAISTHFRYYGGTSSTEYATWVVGRNVRIIHSGFSTPDEVKAFIKSQYDAGTPVKWVYHCIPTIETLPDEMQVSLNNLHTYDGSTYVYTVGTEIQPTIHGTFKSEGWYRNFRFESGINDTQTELSEVQDSLDNLSNTIIPALEDSLITKAEKEAIRASLKQFETEKLDLDSQYNVIYNNTYLEGTAKTNLNSAKTDFNNKYSALQTAINNILAIPDNTIINESLKNAYNSAYTNYKNSLSALSQRLAEAIKAIEDKIADSTYANAQAYINAIKDDLQNQIDGSITTWFYEYAPTNNNAPANQWTTTDDKNKHLGDLFYDLITGYCYRWQVQNSVYSWQRITDTDVTKALEDASKAQTTADGKMKVFVTQPTNADDYQIGDLWIRDGEIWTCKTSKAKDVAYSESHWEKSLKYTDDTVANQNLVVAKQYAEQKASEAENAAKSHAEAKAELARVTAEAYADGIVTAEEQARIADVQAKLQQAKQYAEQQDQVAKQALQEYTDLLTKGSSVIDRDYQTGTSLYSDKADNANVHVDIEGASFQENEPNPENPSEIKSVGTYNPTTEKYEFDVVSSKGNRNLLRNSDFSDGLTNWANQGYSLSVVDGVLIAKNVSGTGTRFYYDIIQMPIGETYTISFEAKADKNNSEVFLGQGTGSSNIGTISLTTVWKRYNITFQSVNNYTISFYLSEPDVDYYFTNIKLEKGNKATDWTPAPEDINYNVSENGINKIAISLDEPLRSVGDVKDRIFRDSDGLWKIERKIGHVVFSGSQSESIYTAISSTGNNYYFNNSIAYYINVANIRTGAGRRAMSSHFTYTPENNYNSAASELDSIHILPGDTHKRVFVRIGDALIGVNSSDTATTAVAKFRTWLQSNPIEVIYVLDDPVVDVLPDEMQVSLNNLLTYEGGTYIYTVGTEIQPTLHGTFKSEAWYRNYRLNTDLYNTQSELFDVKDSLDDLSNAIIPALEDNVLTEAEKQAVKATLKQFESEKADLDAQYNVVYNNSNLTGTPKTNLSSAKNTYNNNFSALQSAVNNILNASGTISSSLRNAYETAYTNYKSSLSTLSTRLHEAIKAIEDKIKSDAESYADSAVDDFAETVYTKGEVDAQLTVTSNSILSTVAGTYVTKDYADETLATVDKVSQVEQTVDGISSTVTSIQTDVTDLDTRLTTAELAITAEAIVSTVRQSQEYLADLNAKASTTALSQVEQTANKISWLVTGNSQAEMELTEEALTVIADEINLQGKVKASWLSITDFSEVGATLSGWTLTPTEIRGTYSSLATVIRTPTHLADVVFQAGDAESPSLRILAWGKLEAMNAEIKGSVSATAFEVLNGDGDKIGGLYGTGVDTYLAAGRLVNPQNITGTNLRVGIVDGHALDGVVLYRNNTPYMTFRNGSWLDDTFVENDIISIGRRLKLTTYTDKTRTDNPSIFLGDYTTTYDGIMLVGNQLYIRAPLGMTIEDTNVDIKQNLQVRNQLTVNNMLTASGEIFFKGKYLYIDSNGYVRGS